MKPSSFESAIRLQFDCLIRKVIDRTVKNYYRELGRRAKHKIPFCDVTEMDLNHAGVMFQMTSRGIVYDWLTMPFLLPFFLLHLWTLCPEVSCYYFYYLRKYNDNPHKNNNTTNQTSNDTIQCQYSHTSCNSKILRHKEHAHFSDTIGTSYQNPIKEIIKPICFIANLLRLLNSCSHPISVPVPGADVSGTY